MFIISECSLYPKPLISEIYCITKICQNEKRTTSHRMRVVANGTLHDAKSSAKVPFQAVQGEERKLILKLLNKLLRIGR